MTYKRSYPNMTLEGLVAIAKGKTSAPSCAEYKLGLGGCGCRGGYPGLPRGAAVNELGGMLMHGELATIGPLAAIMNDLSVAPISYFYLSQKKDLLDPATITLLEQFEKNPENADILEDIRERIAQIAAEEETL